LDDTVTAYNQNKNEPSPAAPVNLRFVGNIYLRNKHLKLKLSSANVS